MSLLRMENLWPGNQRTVLWTSVPYGGGALREQGGILFPPYPQGGLVSLSLTAKNPFDFHLFLLCHCLKWLFSVQVFFYGMINPYGPVWLVYLYLLKPS